MRSRWNFVIVVIYMAFASTLLLYMGVNMAGACGLPTSHCQTLKVEFKNASGLLHSNDLRIAGIKAGEVTKIDVKQNIALVTIQVEHPYQPVYRDTHAIVRPKNLLGETYVEIDRGTPAAGPFNDGDTIPLVNTLTPVQVDEVLNALDADTRTKLQVVINSLGEASAARGQDFNASAADIRRVAAGLAATSTSLNQEKDNLDALLVQLDLMQKTAADYHDQLAEVLRDWNDTSQTLQAHDQALADAVSHLDHILADLDTGLTPNAGALATAVANLPTTIDHADHLLGVSTNIMNAFETTPPGAAGTPLQNGINLFPRLAQVMLGVNQCDYHIYASGYSNVPGTTEPNIPRNGGTCGRPADASGNATNPTLSGEVFSGLPGSSRNQLGKTHLDRHLWRVMGMIEAGPPGAGDTACGLLTPSTQPQTTCSPGNTGLGPWQPRPGSNPSTNSGGFGFWDQLWASLAGGGRA